jgi:uncharacterized membrane protein (UPF0127 family)
MALGLGERDGLEPDGAMLFLYDEPGHYGFWMQGMRFDLDMVWIRGNVVVDITTDVSHREPERVQRPREPADRVLEVVAGTARRHRWSPGAVANFQPPLGGAE